MTNMKYFKVENTGMVISAKNLKMAKLICEMTYFDDTTNFDIVEITKEEALGLFVESLVTYGIEVDVGAIHYMFEDTENEILTFG